MSDYSESGGNKRRNTRNDKDPFSIGPDDTVYRYLCPVKKIGSIIAQGALFRVYDKIISDDTTDENSEEASQVTVKLLVSSNQIGCIIGKGGQIVQDIRSETGAQIRILKDKHLPACALSSDELVQIFGEVVVVKKALFEVASRLHNNPSRTQHILASDVPTIYSSRSSLIVLLVVLQYWE
ncbi:hypothetical protein RDI58_021302 [Solanum bulbocastanum]|uniref:K Homology domain-containing protein n=1 Tax=Solanum bulbocastanum TaxID=147425 RepID=A0AAN8Y8F5_SOLBU